MAKTYPYIVKISNHKATGICVLCGRVKSNRRVHIATTPFRGDDDVYKAHRGCVELTSRKELLRILTSPTKRKIAASSREYKMLLLQNLCERAYWHGEKTGDFGMDYYLEEISSTLSRIEEVKIL